MPNIHELLLVNALYRRIDQLHRFLNLKVVFDEDVIVQEDVVAVIVEICSRSSVRFIQGLSQRGNVWRQTMVTGRVSRLSFGCSGQNEFLGS